MLEAIERMMVYEAKAAAAAAAAPAPAAELCCI
jgi:hypothetical protein